MLPYLWCPWAISFSFIGRHLTTTFTDSPGFLLDWSQQDKCQSISYLGVQYKIKKPAVCRCHALPPPSPSQNIVKSNCYCYTSQLKHIFRLEENVPRHGSKLTNSLGKPQHELSTWTWSCSLKARQICEPHWVKQTISSNAVLSSIELGGITKHLMTGPAGIDLNVSLGFA